MSRNPYIQQRFGSLIHDVVDKENIIRDMCSRYDEPPRRTSLPDMRSNNDDEYDASIGFARFPNSSYRVSTVFRPSSKRAVSESNGGAARPNGVGDGGVSPHTMVTPPRPPPSPSAWRMPSSHSGYARRRDNRTESRASSHRSNSSNNSSSAHHRAKHMDSMWNSYLGDVALSSLCSGSPGRPPHPLHRDTA